MKKKILFITPAQFGYHSGTYYYSKYLRPNFDVTVLSFYSGKKTIKLDGIHVISLPYKRRFVSQFELIQMARNLHMINNYDFVLVLYFALSSILNLCFPKSKIAIYINTSIILIGKPLSEKMFNYMLKLEYRCFRNRIVLSQNLAKYLGLKNPEIIPLGGEFSSKKIQNKTFKDLRLIYVGTLYDRRIEDTINGVKLFLKKFPNLSLKYIIIGMGTEIEISALENEIKNSNLENIVSYVGEIRQHELTKYYDESNIGVSYIPCVERYDNQPPTKTFEYLALGIPVIGTLTKEHSTVINEANGVLINDTPEGFCEGLRIISNRMSSFDTKQISESSKKYSWENIVDTKLYPFILKSIDQ